MDFILDGGQAPGGIESPIVDVTADPPLILQEGIIKREDIERRLCVGDYVKIDYYARNDT